MQNGDIHNCGCSDVDNIDRFVKYLQLLPKCCQLAQNDLLALCTSSLTMQYANNDRNIPILGTTVT